MKNIPCIISNSSCLKEKCCHYRFNQDDSTHYCINNNSKQYSYFQGKWQEILGNRARSGGMIAAMLDKN